MSEVLSFIYRPPISLFIANQVMYDRLRQCKECTAGKWCDLTWGKASLVFLTDLGKDLEGLEPSWSFPFLF